MIEIMRNLAAKRNRIRPFICRDTGQGAVNFGEVVDRRGRGEVGLVELADERQGAYEVGRQVLGVIEEVGHSGLGIRIHRRIDSHVSKRVRHCSHLMLPFDQSISDMPYSTLDMLLTWLIFKHVLDSRAEFCNDC